MFAAMPAGTGVLREKRRIIDLRTFNSVGEIHARWHRAVLSP
jgi:hypothetical protein